MDEKVMGEPVPHNSFSVHGEEQATLQFEYKYLAWF